MTQNNTTKNGMTQNGTTKNGMAQNDTTKNGMTQNDTTRMYADDTHLTYAGGDLESIQLCLNEDLTNVFNE